MPIFLRGTPHTFIGHDVRTVSHLHVFSLCGVKLELKFVNVSGLKKFITHFSFWRIKSRHPISMSIHIDANLTRCNIVFFFLIGNSVQHSSIIQIANQEPPFLSSKLIIKYWKWNNQRGSAGFNFLTQVSFFYSNFFWVNFFFFFKKNPQQFISSTNMPGIYSHEALGASGSNLTTSTVDEGKSIFPNLMW